VHEQATENSVMSAECKDGGGVENGETREGIRVFGNKVGFRRPLRGLF
jgi:hypothetical protein